MNTLAEPKRKKKETRYDKQNKGRLVDNRGVWKSLSVLIATIERKKKRIVVSEGAREIECSGGFLDIKSIGKKE